MKLRKTLLCLALASLCIPIGAGPAEQSSGPTTREFEIVPCLLPARIRKLGNMNYAERRRLVEVSARDCHLRGGEYTFYDRAKPEASVQFFQDLASNGDTEAQVSLGDVYQYLFVDPNYQEAAHWYRKAADAGNKKGMMQLARLYERGLGVEEDALLATNLWRRATGAGEELVLASTLEQAQTQATARIAQLTQQLRASNESAESVRSELATARNEINARRTNLERSQAEVAQLQKELQQVTQASADPQEIAQLKLTLKARERTITEQRDQIDSLEDNIGIQEAQLSANLRQVERQNKRLAEQLSQVNAQADDALESALAQLATKDQEVQRLRTDFNAARATLNNADKAQTDLLAQLELARNAAGDSKRALRKVADLEEKSAKQANQIQTQRVSISRLESQLQVATNESNALRGRLDSQINAQAETEANLATTEAELQRVRSAMVDLQSQLATANADLALAGQQRDALQEQAQQATGDTAAVTRLESDLATQNQNIKSQQRQIEELTAQVNAYADELTEIRLRRSALAMRTPMLDTSSIRLPRGVKMGKYHALVIGNNDYEYLTDLENAESDARAMHELLQNEYGFNSTLLINGTEGQMFRAFEDLASELGEHDLVLIYYAGHGFRSKNESYWLPVELTSRRSAELDGISSMKVADWVRAMPAKHVMIVADSCYSGSGIQTTGGFRYDIATLEASLPYFLKSKSRTMLTSGNVAPVMDGGGQGKHSIFTDALLGLLSENKGILHAGALHDYLVERVKYASDGTRINQTPQFGSIESAGHESGQFVFIHRNVRGV